MNAILRRNPFISALAAIGIALLVVLALEMRAATPAEKAAGAAQKPVNVQARLLPPIAAVNPEQEYPETGARPLFIPTRRPAPAQNVAAATTMVKGQFTLTGVTIVGPLKIALLREKSSGRVVRVEQGKEVNGLTVSQIDPDRVTLAQGGDQEVVGLLVHKGPGGPAQPAAGAAPPAGPFGAAPHAVPDPTVNPNPAARPVAPPGFGAPQPTPGAPAAPNPNTLFGPRPGGLTPVPAPDSSAAPLTPEELLARRRAQRRQQTQ